MANKIDISQSTKDAIDELIELFDKIIKDPYFIDDENVEDAIFSPIPPFTTIVLDFSIPEEHRILTGANYTKYHKAVVSVFDDVEKKTKTLSHKMAEKIISDMLREDWKSAQGNKAIELEKKKLNGRKFVQNKINLPLSKWRVYYAVRGINPPSLPVQLGKHKLLNFSDDFIDNELKQALGVPEQETHDNLPYHRFINTAVPDMIQSSVVFEISVEAHDSNAANDLAMKEAEITLDVINFFADYQSNVCAFLPQHGNKIDSHYEALMFNESQSRLDSKRSFENRIKYGIGFDIEKLGICSKDIGYQSVLDILAKNNRSKFEQSLLAAIQMAGKAAATEEISLSFLLYTIALESLLGGNDKTEITLRLSQRLPLLIENDGANRLMIRNKFKELYGIRSALVHTGKTEISNEDYQILRILTLRCIFTILQNDDILKFKSSEDFLKWLDDKTLFHSQLPSTQS